MKKKEEKKGGGRGREEGKRGVGLGHAG